MAVKRRMHPLRGGTLVSDEHAALLAAVGITTVEELVGALVADATAVSRMLSLDGAGVVSLRERALASLPHATRQALTAPVAPRAYGAVDPRHRREE